jgi:Na+-transporting methylmalonyl-CoA/oxaloacetate decarboxylase gamma subunit
MHVLGLTSTQESLWWVTLGLGLIVLLAVAALLTLLVTLVGTIEKRVDLIRSTLDQAESNTSDTALIAETADRVDAVLTEGLEHHLFLGRVLDKVRS